MAPARLDGHGDVARARDDHPLRHRLAPGLEHRHALLGREMRPPSGMGPHGHARRPAGRPSSARTPAARPRRSSSPRNGTGTAGTRPHSQPLRERDRLVSRQRPRASARPRCRALDGRPVRRGADPAGRAWRRRSPESAAAGRCRPRSGRRRSCRATSADGLRAGPRSSRCPTRCGRPPRRRAEVDFLDEGPVGVGDEQADARVAPDERAHRGGRQLGCVIVRVALTAVLEPDRQAERHARPRRTPRRARAWPAPAGSIP